MQLARLAKLLQCTKTRARSLTRGNAPLEGGIVDELASQWDRGRRWGNPVFLSACGSPHNRTLFSRTYLHRRCLCGVMLGHLTPALMCSSPLPTHTALHHLLTSLSWRMRARERARERERGRDVKVSMRGCFLPHIPLFLHLPAQDCVCVCVDSS